MTEIFLMKCSFGIHAGKFLYKFLANNGDPVWSTGVDYAREFELREELELFAVDKEINHYVVIPCMKHTKE